MKRLWATLVGVFVLGQVLAGRVEAVDLLGPTHKDLQNQHNDQKNQHTTLQNQHTDQASQHTQLQNQHTDQASQHTNLQNQLNAIQSQLGEVLPPWSRELPAAERFVPVLGGTAVVDRETALVWEQSLDTTDRSWSIAQFFCNTRTVGNRQGWRLPTLQELASLVDPTHENPALPAGHPFANVQSSFYWSATTLADSSNSAWVVDLGFGGSVNDNKATANFVWCVRGGHGGPDAQ